MARDAGTARGVVETRERSLKSEVSGADERGDEMGMEVRQRHSRAALFSKQMVRRQEEKKNTFEEEGEMRSIQSSPRLVELLGFSTPSHTTPNMSVPLRLPTTAGS